ncbi:hypothetical protein HNO89_000525 [Sporosarcina luteola]|nr:hypothetical protein [Sporosarcina luteola]
MKKLTFFFLLPLLLMACTNEKLSNSAEVPSTSEERDDTVSSKNPNLHDFFMQDGSIAHFQGDGNEYATYTSRTKWLDERHVNVYEDNGGVEMLRTYRLGDNKIELLQEEPSDTEGISTTLQAIQNLKPLRTYLEFPLEKGATFDEWAVIATDADLETPLQSFQDVIIIERTFDDGAISRVYFAVGFGEIKREYVANEGGHEFKVTSVIQQIE